MEKLNPNIKIVENERKKHSKASEEYIHVEFTYSDSEWDGWVPVEYRRTGLSIKSEEQLNKYLNEIYPQMNPSRYPAWLEKQEKFWKKNKAGAKVTKSFFDVLAEGGWKCGCDLPQNPNPSRRIQDIKDCGYIITTDTKRYCPKCKKNTAHWRMLPIERANNDGNGYETWSPFLRKNIMKVLEDFDVYECKKSKSCLPDHKFSEIRWDKDTKSENSDNMTDEEIRQKFQLLSNQINQKKREVCRICFQTGKRGIAYGIPYFYEGNEEWDSSIPKSGKEAERGCIGCAWYDFAEWRKHLIDELNSQKSSNKDNKKNI